MMVPRFPSLKLSTLQCYGQNALKTSAALNHRRELAETRGEECAWRQPVCEKGEAQFEEQVRNHVQRVEGPAESQTDNRVAEHAL